MLCQKYIHYPKKINLIVDEYDGEVLDEAKKNFPDKFSDREMLTYNEKEKAQKTYFECYKMQK